MPCNEPSNYIIPRFGNDYIPLKPPEPRQQLSCPTHCPEQTNNISLAKIFDIGQKHLTTISDSCPPKVDGEMVPIKKKIIVMFFMALLGHGIGESLLMARLGHVLVLKVKLKLHKNRNNIKMKI